jgi:hypothetical protein
MHASRSRKIEVLLVCSKMLRSKVHILDHDGSSHTQQLNQGASSASREKRGWVKPSDGKVATPAVGSFPRILAHGSHGPEILSERELRHDVAIIRGATSSSDGEALSLAGYSPWSKTPVRQATPIPG